MLFVKNIPLYKKVSKKILEMIHDGEFEKNILPSEEYLAKTFGVSRTTVREALSELTSQGIITKRQGHGNIVMQSALKAPYRIDLKLDFAGMLAEKGVIPKFIQSVSRYEHLVLDGMEDNFFVYDELLFADDKIAAVFKIHISRGKFATEPPPDMPKNNFFEFIYDYTSEVIAHSIVYFEGALADEKLAGAFGLELNSPLLSWKELFYTVRDECICHNRIHFNPNVFTPTMLRSSFDPEEIPTSLECETTDNLEAYMSGSR